MRVWKISEGESTWVAAETAEEALDLFWSEHGECDCSLDIEDVTAKAANMLVRDEDSIPCGSLAALAEVPGIIGSTVW